MTVSGNNIFIGYVFSICVRVTFPFTLLSYPLLSLSLLPALLLLFAFFHYLNFSLPSCCCLPSSSSLFLLIYFVPHCYVSLCFYFRPGFCSYLSSLLPVYFLSLFRSYFPFLVFSPFRSSPVSYCFSSSSSSSFSLLFSLSVLCLHIAQY